MTTKLRPVPPDKALAAACASLRAERDRLTMRVAELERSLDAYRAQATGFAERLVELGHGDVVDRAIAEAD